MSTGNWGLMPGGSVAVPLHVAETPLQKWEELDGGKVEVIFFYELGVIGCNFSKLCLR